MRLVFGGFDFGFSGINEVTLFGHNVVWDREENVVGVFVSADIVPDHYGPIGEYNLGEISPEDAVKDFEKAYNKMLKNGYFNISDLKHFIMY